MSKLLRVSAIQRLPELQARVEMNQEYISELRELWRENVVFPPVVVFTDDKGSFWLADGFHRVLAAELESVSQIQADVRYGNPRIAMLYAIGANRTHGLKRSNADKRKAVLMLLNDGEWQEWSQGKIAAHCGVTRPYVSKLQAQMTGNVSSRDEKTSTISAMAPEANNIKIKETENPPESTLRPNRVVKGKDGRAYRVLTGGKKLPTPEQRVLQLIAELRAVLAEVQLSCFDDIRGALDRVMASRESDVA